MNRGRIIHVLALIAIVSSLVISGCVTAPPEAAPTPTATPVTTTPAPTGTGVEILKAPATAEAGKSFEVSWRVNSPVQKNIPHTAAHYGKESKSEPLTLKSYPSLTTPISGMIPAEFSTNMLINATGITYFRAHAIIDGKHYWSSEMMVTITTPSNVTAQVTPTVTPTARATTPGGY